MSVICRMLFEIYCFWLFFFSKTTASSNFADADPFVVLESTTSAPHSSSGLFVDPLDVFAASVTSQGKKPSQSSSTKLKPPPKPTPKVDRG